MITRNITANTPTQVKSAIIGVEIAGETYNCEVSFSVEGTEFTKIGENLNEKNNVICNIPKSVYLKFSQDVIICEE